MRQLWIMFMLGIMLTLTFGQKTKVTGPSANSSIEVPLPERRLSIREAMALYFQIIEEWVKYLDPANPRVLKSPMPGPYVCALERILLDFPDGRVILMEGFGLPKPLTLQRAGIREGLSACYFAEGKWDEALALAVQGLLLDWDNYFLLKLHNIHPFPDPFRGDPPAAVLDFVKRIKEMQRKGARFSPLIFVRGWCLRARWKGDDPKDALVSLNDFAYALGYDQWREIIQRDWKEWRFTFSIKGKTISFTAGSKKANINGKEFILTHQIERSFYDLYVPLGDLVKALDGTIRSPKADELPVLQHHLPVPLLVVDLD